MKKLYAYLKAVHPLWLILWVAIYLTFAIMGAFLPYSPAVTVLKLSSIALCLIYAVIKYPKDLLLIIALAFTLSADLFLAFDNISTTGVVLFCLAQFFHFSRFKKFRLIYLVCLLLIITTSISVSLLLGFSPIYPLAAVYGVLLISNLVLSYQWCQKSKTGNSACAFYGFSLFLACDFCVQASFLSVTHALPSYIARIADYLAWIFYCPSQILIANSSNQQSPSSKTKKFAKSHKSMLK